MDKPKLKIMTKECFNSIGQYHREDGPAIEWNDSYKEWIQNGQYHRLDGPAIEGLNDFKVWYYRGKLINCTSQEEFERWLKLKAFW